MRVLTIFGLLLMLVIPHLPAQAAFPSGQRAACCCGDAPSCPCTAGPEEPGPAEPIQATVQAPAPQAELHPESWQALGFQAVPAEPLPEPSRVAPAVYIVTCTFRC